MATIGPASTDPLVMRQMVEAGVDVFRLNFSHGTHDVHTATLQAIRQIAAETETQLAVLQDLCGPKIRLGEIVGGVVECDHDAEFVLVDRAGGDRRPASPDLDLPHAGRRPGCGAERAFRRRHGRDGCRGSRPGLGAAQGHAAGAHPLESGDQCAAGGLECRRRSPTKTWPTSTGRRRTRSTTSGSRSCGGPRISRCCAASSQRRGSRARIIAKIEKPQALANLDAIVAEADAVMVARGDLGVELDVVRVPAIQKQIIDACHRARVPVITATQMLNSMESSSRPTRAEASDVFNAVLDGTDAVMLSGETAIGQYPVESVTMMSRIAG